MKFDSVVWRKPKFDYDKDRKIKSKSDGSSNEIECESIYQASVF